MRTQEASDRRHFPRLKAHVYWRTPGLRGLPRPVVDVGLGGMRMYSDETVTVGTELELELLLPDACTIEVLARVVRVDVLPPGAPAHCDVALEFLDVPVTEMGRLSEAMEEAAP